MPNITHFKSPTGEELPIADATARLEIGTLQQRADDTDHAVHDLDTAVKELQDTTIRVYDSLDDVPADLPEGSFVAVPAEENAGGGGLPVVEIATLPTEEGVLLTEEESAKMNALNGGMCVLKVNYVQDDVGYPVTAYPSIVDNGVMLIYMCLSINYYIAVAEYEGIWRIQQLPLVA